MEYMPQERYEYINIIEIDVSGNESYTPELLKVKNQGRSSKCVAYAISSLLELQHRKTTGYLIEGDENYIWKNGARASDGGMYLGKTLKKLGLEHYRTNNNDKIKDAILNSYVLIDIKVDKAFKRNRTGVIKIASKSTKGNHSMLVVGYTHVKGKLHWKVQNSWGKKWGRNGCVLLPHYYKNINYFYIIKSERE